jgi:integrase
MVWRAAVAKQIRDDDYSPHTGNDWLALLGIILGEAVDRFELEDDPMRKVPNFDTRAHRTYTREAPNSLPPEQVPAFLTMMGEKFPQFLGITTVGFATGLRPSSLRPLRRKGLHADLLLSEGILLVRRSHTEGDVAIEMTKTARDQEIVLPKDLVDILQWHIETQLKTPEQVKSDLLFPAEDGGFLHRNRLRMPFEVVCEALQLPFAVTPRGMRRTFQDLARAAQLHDFVTRAVSGHATEAMQKRYSTVSSVDVQQGLAKVIELTKARAALESAQASGGRGAHRSAHGHKTTKAG